MSSCRRAGTDKPRDLTGPEDYPSGQADLEISTDNSPGGLSVNSQGPGQENG